MSRHSTHRMLCRASQVDADWEIAACPEAQMTDYFTAGLQCFVLGTVQLLGPNRDAGGNTHCNLPASHLSDPFFPTCNSVSSYPQSAPSLFSLLQYPVPVCSQVSRPHLKRSPKSCHPEVFAITGCVATSQLLSEIRRLMFSSADCWLSI